MRALESLVRSIGRYGSLCMTVMEDLLPFSRNDWTAPIVALPLYITFQLAYDLVKEEVRQVTCPPTMRILSCPSMKH